MCTIVQYLFLCLLGFSPEDFTHALHVAIFTLMKSLFQQLHVPVERLCICIYTTGMSYPFPQAMEAELGGGANKPRACHRVSLFHWSRLELQQSLRLFQDTGAEKESPGGVVFPAGVGQSEISAAAGLAGDAAITPGSPRRSHG